MVLLTKISKKRYNHKENPGNFETEERKMR